MSGSTVRPVVAIPVGEIVVPPQRLRTLKPEQAMAIGRSIEAHGQFDPITVVRQPGKSHYVLVDGWHRLDGCIQLGLPTIEARLIGMRTEERVRHEAVSGIARAAHDVLDRAAAVDALARLAREEAGLPEEGDLRARNQFPVVACKRIDADTEALLDTMSKSMRWDEGLAEAMGMSSKSIRRLRRIHLRLPDEIKDRLRAAGVADELAALNALAGFSDRQMLQVCVWLEVGEAATLTAAVAMLTEPEEPANPVQKQQNAFFRKAEAWTPRDRASFFHQWSQEYHPDGRRRSQAKG